MIKKELLEALKDVDDNADVYVKVRDWEGGIDIPTNYNISGVEKEDSDVILIQGDMRWGFKEK